MKKAILVFLTLFAFLLINVKAQTVAVCGGKYSKRYHVSASCNGLSNCKGGVSSVSLENAIKMGRTPCLICNPPSAPTSTTPAVKQNSTPEYQQVQPAQQENHATVQCAATTKKGSRCKRMTKSPNGYCWQHGGS